MNSKQRAGYIRQEKWRDQRRENPSRAEWILRKAVDKADLNTIGYEYKLEDDKSGRWYWFDVACRVRGQLVLFDVVGGYDYSGGNKRRKEIIEEKKELCDREGIPLLTISNTRGTMEMVAQIHSFLAGIKGGVQ